MKLLVYTRHDLTRHGLTDRRLGPEDPALLLEGSWPADAPSPVDRSSTVHWSLDEAIDGRFDWIDQQAADWAELLAGAGPPGYGTGSPFDCVSPAYLNALALRYYLVKLLRLPAYFSEVRPLHPGDRVELIAAAGEEDYAEVLSQLCRTAGVCYRVRWVEDRRRRLGGFPPNGRWRRWAARLSRCFHPAAGRGSSRRRVVLCGNPRLLDPVCRELLARRCNLWSLYDRFAVKSWLRWQATGIEQLVCDSSLGRENRLRAYLPDRLDFRGVNLAGPIGRWLAARVAAHGPRQTRLIEQIDAHFRRVRPDTLVLDEDATPLARAAVAIARRYGASSFVVQHGVPCCRFGFSPPAADCILVWGRSSQRQLIDWGVPPERIRITGSPQHDHWYLRRETGYGRRGTRPPRILLLTTVPPRDARPDAVALHLTSRTYAEMLRRAFAAVARTDGVELIVKLHPRTADDPTVRALRAEFPTLRNRVVHGGPLKKWLRGIDCVLSCGSSAGVEATISGVPVIQLAPPGAGGFLPHDRWAVAGTARSETELQQLLARVLAEGWRPASGPDRDVFADFGQPAAARIAEEVLAPTDPMPPAPHFQFTPKTRQPMSV